MSKMARKHKKGYKGVMGILMISALLAIPSLFNSCSANHSGNSELNFASLDNDPCGFKQDFQKIYRPFVKAQCARCHISGGQGKGRFADADINKAWVVFSVVGYQKINEMAVNPAHKPPYTGPRNQSVINKLSSDWEKALQQKASCKSGGTNQVIFNEKDWFQTKSTAIGVSEVGDDSKVTWRIPEDILPSALSLPSTTGGKISVKVEVGEILERAYYKISEPILDLSGASGDLSIAGLRVKVNGSWIEGQTTFQDLNGKVRKGESMNLSAGLLNFTDIVNEGDVLSLGIHKLNDEDLPPPPAQSKVSFRVASITAPAEDGTISVFVDMDREVTDQTVTVPIVVADGSADNKSGNPGSSAHQLRNDGLQILDEEYETISVRNFNWDFEIVNHYASNISLIFAPGERSKEIRIKIANDDRVEGSETITMTIGNDVQGAQKDGSKDKFVMTIPNDNDVATGRTTFTELVSSTGYLGEKCLKCHNSEVANQNNDLTDYFRVTDAGNLLAIPYMPDRSEILLRTQTEDLLRKMPCATIDGQCVGSEGLPDLGAAKLRDWIEAGAKND